MIFHPPLAKSNGPGLPVTHIRKSDIQFPDRQGISLHESLVLKAKVPRFQRFRRHREGRRAAAPPGHIGPLVNTTSMGFTGIYHSLKPNGYGHNSCGIAYGYRSYEDNTTA